MKPRSRDVTDGIEATTSRGMLRAVGMGDADWDKPQIGIASSWNEITPCNLSLDRLAQASKEGVHSGGGYPLQFGTISVSDGISMGHEGMHFSLVSREVIADSVEVVMQAERLDGSVLLAGCDKSLPGMLMAAARLDLASVFLYAGSIAPGWVKLSDGTEKDITIIDSFEAVGAVKAGRMSVEDAKRIECAFAPGEGACGAGADGFERVDEGDFLFGAVLQLDPAGHDGAGVEEDAGKVQAGGSHEHAREGLVAAGQEHRAVDPFGLHDGFHGVGYDFARNEGEVHAFVPHGDAVRD